MEDEVVVLVPTSLIDPEQASLRRQFFQKRLPAIVTPDPPASPLEKRETQDWNGNVEIRRPKIGRETLEEIKRPWARHHRNTRRVALTIRGRPVTPNSTWARPLKGRSHSSTRTSGAQTRQLDVEEVKHAKGGSYQHRETDTRRPVPFHGPGRQKSHTTPYPWHPVPSESGRFKPTQALPEKLRENNSSTAAPVCSRSTEGFTGKHETTADREDADGRETSFMQNNKLAALDKQASNALMGGNKIYSSQPRSGMSVLDLHEDRLETATQNQLVPAAVESSQNRFILHSGGERTSATPETGIENQSTSSVLPHNLPASLVATVNSLAEDIRNLKATQQQALSRKTEHEMKLEEDMRSLEKKIRRDFEALTEHLIHRENVATLAAELGLSPSSRSFQTEIAATKQALVDSPLEACALQYPDKNLENLKTSTNAVCGSSHLAAQRSRDAGRPPSPASRRLSPSRHPDFPASKEPRPDKDADRTLGSVSYLPRRVELRVVPQKVHRKTNRAVESRCDRDGGRPLVLKDSSSFKNDYAPPQARTILQDLNSVLTCLTAVNVFDPAASCSTGHASPKALLGDSGPSRQDAPVLFRPISETTNLPICGANVREENRQMCQSALPGFASGARNAGDTQNRERHLKAALPQRSTTVRAGLSSISIPARLRKTAGEAPSRIPRPSVKTAVVRRASLATQRGRSPSGQNKSRIPAASQVVSSQELLVSPSLVHRGENEVCHMERLLDFFPLKRNDGDFPRAVPLGNCPLLAASLVPHKGPSPVFLEASTRVKPSYLSRLSPGSLDLPCPHQAEVAYTTERHNVPETRQKALDESISRGRKLAPESSRGRVSTSTGRCPWHGTGKQRLLEEKSLTSLSPASSILRRASRPSGRSLERLSGSQRVGSGSPLGTTRRQRACTVVFSDSDSWPFQAMPRNRASSAGSLRSHNCKQCQARAGEAGHGPCNPLRSSNCLDTAPLTSAKPRNERSGSCTRSGTNRKCRRCEACDPSRLATPGTAMSVKRVRGPVIGPPPKYQKPRGITPSNAFPGTTHRPNAEYPRVTACARQLQQGTSPLKVLRVERGVSPVASGLHDDTTPTARHLCDADDDSLTELQDDSDASTTSLTLSSASSTPLSSFVSSTTSLDCSLRQNSHERCAGSLSSNCPHLRKRRMCGTSRCFRSQVSKRLHSGSCLEHRGESERQFNRLTSRTADFWQGGWESRALWAGAPGHPGCLPWGPHCAIGERLWTPWKSLVVRHEMAVQTRTAEREVGITWLWLAVSFLIRLLRSVLRTPTKSIK
ncbi:hypothetical protein TGDOM2_251420 [Toxoplasma gondii GAB2-2007-GAL-DOM2]|uniref:Uncharacterized protein n=1 Tax=Toxoplasma gondii GAB2-2007-GAL-DOM2 TaxID=1130820 RepID=A0A086K8V3_TOXGO|nr:hypothetical protein TGDOM2_251420 [Toxoplasma gondii GAB2-2007-GAL-DOM2]